MRSTLKTMHQSDEELVSLLRQNGLKVTPQRLAIFRFLTNNDHHPSADLIYEEVKKELPTISQGTVYKTLSRLTDIGVIKELSFGNGHSRYDSNTDLHINVICPICNRISDYQSNNVNRFWETITTEIGGDITGQRFDIYRTCKGCNGS